MDRKALLFSVIAAAGLVLLVAVSAVTVYALAGNHVETTPVEKAVEVAPAQVEPVNQIEGVDTSNHNYRNIDYFFDFFSKR